MNKSRSCMFGMAALLIAQCLVAISSAQNYPSRQMRIIVGFPAGGGTDATARLVAQKLTERMGQPVVVENHPGASGSIGVELVTKSKPDGYTLLIIAAGDAIVPALRLKMPYDLERDLAPILMVTTSPLALVVHPSVPVHNAKELIALAKSQPGKLNYSSSGTGTTLYLVGELFNMMADVKTVHVPYNGTAEAALSVAKGETDMSFPSLSSALPVITSGKVRAIAVTSLQRSSALPSVPTLDESGLKGYDRGTWAGFLAPAGVPRDIIARLNDVTVKAINAPEVREVLVKQGLEPQSNTPEEFAAMLHRELAQNAELIKRSGLKPQ